MNKKTGNMSLIGHLSELRKRLIISIITLCVTFLIIFQFADNIVEYLTLMGVEYGYAFVYIAPQELFIQYMKVGFIGAFCISSPVILFQIARFLAPGLKKNENLAMLFTMTFGLLFFLLGVLFAYKISIPFMLNFFVSVNTTSNIVANISISNYISMLVTVFLVFGIVFELPVVAVLLTQLGLLKPEWMIAARPAAIVVIFFIGAVITPPDVVSQCLISLPMVVLYQISIYLCKIFYKRRNKIKAEEEEDTMEES